jgi:hypothetical protein
MKLEKRIASGRARPWKAERTHHPCSGDHRHGRSDAESEDNGIAVTEKEADANKKR